MLDYKQAIYIMHKMQPNLLVEVSLKDFEKELRKYITLGNFAEILPQHCTKKWPNQYYILIRKDHSDFFDENKVIPTIFHEYGHYLCRTKLYPKLGLLGKYCLKKKHSRPFGVMPDYTTNVIVVIEEFLAWCVSWWILFQNQSLNIECFKYGLSCWKNYLHRLM